MFVNTGQFLLAADGASDPVTALLQYGVLGIFAAVLLVLSRTLLKREQARSDRLEAEVTRLNQLIQEKTIPALITATQAIQASQEYLKALQYQRDVAEAGRRAAAKGEVQ